jgi:hypothetical protein
MEASIQEPSPIAGLVNIMPPGEPPYFSDVWQTKGL